MKNAFWERNENLIVSQKGLRFAAKMCGNGCKNSIKWRGLNVVFEWQSAFQMRITLKCRMKCVGFSVILHALNLNKVIENVVLMRLPDEFELSSWCIAIHRNCKKFSEKILDILMYNRYNYVLNWRNRL